MRVEELEAFGFREFPVNPRIDRYDRVWSYVRRDRRGKKFFVHVRMWRHSKYSTPDNPLEDGWDAMTYLEVSRSVGFHVNFPVREMTPGRVVRTVAGLFNKLKCRYHEEYECRPKKTRSRCSTRKKATRTTPRSGSSAATSAP